MRPNKTGWGLVIFFFVAGVAFWIAMPEVFIGQIWVAVAAFLAFLYSRMNRKADEALDLQREGVRGEARILEMTQTGVYINQQPRVKLKLAIQAPGVAPFEHERTETVPLIALGRLTGGTALAVYLKPEAPHEYVIDWFGPAGPEGAGAGGITVNQTGGGTIDLGTDPDARHAVLAALQEHGIDTSSGQVDLRQAGAARDAVLEALRKQGIDVAHQVAVQDPTVPIADSGEPLERLTKLTQLRDANLITAAEFDRYRKDILDDI